MVPAGTSWMIAALLRGFSRKDTSLVVRRKAPRGDDVGVGWTVSAGDDIVGGLWSSRYLWTTGAPRAPITPMNATRIAMPAPCPCIAILNSVGGRIVPSYFRDRSLKTQGCINFLPGRGDDR